MPAISYNDTELFLIHKAKEETNYGRRQANQNDIVDVLTPVMWSVLEYDNAV